jgi:hypothetical protein
MIGLAIGDDQGKPTDHLRNEIGPVILDPKYSSKVHGYLGIARTHIVVSVFRFDLEKEYGFSGGEDLKGFHQLVEEMGFR